MSSTKKKVKRGFAILNRNQALKSAAKAINPLRELSKFESSPTAWRCGLGYALEMVETQLNDILLFSCAKRLPDDLFGGAEAVAVPADLGKARKDAAGAVKVVQKILRDARADLSVDEYQCNRLDNALDLVEQELNNLLPPPGAPTGAKLPFDEEEDEPQRNPCSIEGVNIRVGDR